MEVNDVDEANRFGVGAGGLVHCDGEGGAIGDLVELLSAEVVEEDWVWLHLRKERLPTKRKSKLSPKGDGPFQCRMGTGVEV